MKTSLIALALALSAGTGANATVLIFDGNICNGGQSCANGGPIDQSYGDTADVDFQTRYESAFPQQGSVYFWPNNYNELVNVAFGGNNPSIFFALNNPGTIKLNSFNLGGWPNTSRNTQVTIFDGLGATLFSSGPITVGANGMSTLFSPNLSSSNGIGINWGPDGFNVGIDNIDYTFEGAVAGAVPEPATWAMMISGFGLVGASMRRSRRKKQVRFIPA